ncbi:MAG TPA: cell envelope integrity protein TolA [Gammaproteobacteria bacterium]|nr:cell envelope integrity protein TolA [Gammaproteobacteria bacterium]
MMKATTEKKPFLLWSCILHVSILLFLILDITFSGSSAPASQPNIIQAVAISSKTLAQYQQAVVQKQVTKQQAIQKVQDLLKAEQAAQQAAQMAAAKAAEQEQAAQKQAAADAAAKAIAVQKAVADAAAAKAAQKAAAAEMKQSIEKQLKASMQKQLSETKPTTKSTTKPTTTTSAKPSTSTVKSNPGLMDKYKSAIIQAISEQWIVPQNLPKDISCVLSVRVAPGGVVIQVSVTKSSGNPVLDNSAVAAVNKASPLPVPTDPNLFDAFRTMTLTVKPDGSMLEN